MHAMNQQDAYSKLITDGELLLARRIQSGHPFIYDSVDKVAYNQWVMTCVAHFESITPTHASQIQAIYNPDVANVNMVEQILGVVRSGVDFIHTMTASAEDINQTDKPENYNISFWTKAIQEKCKQHFLNGA